MRSVGGPNRDGACAQDRSVWSHLDFQIRRPRRVSGDTLRIEVAGIGKACRVVAAVAVWLVGRLAAAAQGGTRFKCCVAELCCSLNKQRPVRTDFDERTLSAPEIPEKTESRVGDIARPSPASESL